MHVLGRQLVALRLGVAPTAAARAGAASATQPGGALARSRRGGRAARAEPRTAGSRRPLTSQPSPVGDCASKPTASSAASSPRVKWRMRLPGAACPSTRGTRNAGPRARAMRSQTSLPSTTNPFASSDVPRVTTDTTIGSLVGENSKARALPRARCQWRHVEHEGAGVECGCEADGHARTQDEVAGDVADERRAVEDRLPHAGGVDEPVGARASGELEGRGLCAPANRLHEPAHRHRHCVNPLAVHEVHSYVKKPPRGGLLVRRQTVSVSRRKRPMSVPSSVAVRVSSCAEAAICC